MKPTNGRRGWLPDRGGVRGVTPTEGRRGVREAGSARRSVRVSGDGVRHVPRQPTAGSHGEKQRWGPGKGKRLEVGDRPAFSLFGFEHTHITESQLQELECGG